MRSHASRISNLSVLLMNVFFEDRNLLVSLEEPKDFSSCKEKFACGGTRLSPIIADIVLQDLEEEALRTLSYNLPFFYRYVDDIVCAIPVDEHENVLNVFNVFHYRLQFTIEASVNNTLNFLDVTMIISNNYIIFDWYHKPTFSGRYLNYFSQHPLCQKRDIILISLINKVFTLSHPIFHTKNFNLVINILHDNCYPIEFVFGILRQRLKTLMFGNLNNVTHMDNDNLQQKIFLQSHTFPQFLKSLKASQKTKILLFHITVLIS